MGEFKLSARDALTKFNGEGDVLAWLEEVEMVADLTEVTKVARLIPLYLRDGALAVYTQMSTADKKDVEKIKSALKKAFCDSKFTAYKKLITATWKGGPVSVYANELRRLADLAGYTGAALEHCVKLAFVTGFPDRISVALQQMDEIDSITVESIVTRARILVENGTEGTGGEVAAVAQVKRGYTHHNTEGAARKGEGAARTGSKPGVRCFSCNGPHYVRECPSRKITCYRCGQEGHISSQCSGNQ